MSAKSAPQHSYSRHARSAELHLRGTLAVLALALVVTLSGSLVEPAHAPSQALPPPSGPEPAETAAAPEPVVPVVASQAEPSREEGRYKALSEFLARRYKVSQEVTLDLVTIAHAAGRQIGLDPLLIIAVIAVESRFNPIAESVAGAKGLMQVIPKYHTEKLREYGGDRAVFDPETNILVGARILKEYLSRTGSLNTALQMYGGALSDENDIYTGKVMTEKQRLQQVLRRANQRRADVEA